MEGGEWPKFNLGVGEYVKDRTAALKRVLSGIWHVGSEVELCTSNHIRHEDQGVDS